MAYLHSSIWIPTLISIQTVNQMATLEHGRTVHTARSRIQIRIPTTDHKKGIGIGTRIGFPVSECK